MTTETLTIKKPKKVNPSLEKAKLKKLILKDEPGYESGKMDYSEMDYSNKDLSGKTNGVLKYNFKSSNCRNTDFSGANLTGQCFQGANITGANFTGANCTDADFRWAYGHDVITDDADFTGADVRECDAL